MMIASRVCTLSRCVWVRAVAGGGGQPALPLCTSAAGPTAAPAPPQPVSQPAPATSRDITASSQRALTISRQMKIYLENKRKHEDFLREQEAEYEIGKRHLANIMGADPDNFTQEDVDKAIRYLLPSGLFDKKARPMMVHPSRLFPPARDAQFDNHGRPFSFLFYTGKPNFYQIMHETESHLYALYKLEDEMMNQGIMEPDPDEMLSLDGYGWITREQMEARVLEKIREEEFSRFVACLTRLIEHPYSYKVKTFILNYFNKLPEPTSMVQVPEIQYDAEGRAYTESKGKRKRAVAYVTCHVGGSGHFYINDISIYQQQMPIQIREALLFPLTFTRLLGVVDVSAHIVTEPGRPTGGPTGEAGAIRLALSKCLTAFLSEDMRERMRQAGLLQRDVRRRERKKPGKPGARSSPTWRKR